MTFILLLASFALAKDVPVEKPSPSETTLFRDSFEKSGQLVYGHKVKKLNPGDGFFVIHGACRDKDDLYFLSLDNGAEIETQKGTNVADFYPIGSGGGLSYVFKHHPESSYFQFLGRDVYRWPVSAGVKPGNSSPGENADENCPTVRVSVHGANCNKAGADACFGKLVYTRDSGYTLQLPPVSPPKRASKAKVTD